MLAIKQEEKSKHRFMNLIPEPSLFIDPSLTKNYPGYALRSRRDLVNFIGTTGYDL